MCTMKYDKMLAKLKGEQKTFMCIVVPVFLLVIIAMMRFAFKTGEAFVWILILAMAAAFILILRRYTNYDGKFMQMWQSIGAGNSAEFARIVEQSQDFEDLYFVHEQFFLNFYTFCAYPRSEITGVRTYEDRNEDSGSAAYGIYVIHGHGETDRIVCDGMVTRDRLAAALRGFQS